MSLFSPVSHAASSAPRMPSGTTSSTEIGTDQLSYSAARHRNTISSDRPYSAGAWPPDNRSSNDSPVHSSAVPGGSLAWISSIASIAAPVLRPGPGAPCSCIADCPL